MLHEKMLRKQEIQEQNIPYKGLTSIPATTKPMYTFKRNGGLVFVAFIICRDNGSMGPQTSGVNSAQLGSLLFRAGV